MVYQFIAGASAVSAIAREVGLSVSVADLGVDHDFGEATGLTHHKVRRGTRNLRREPATRTLGPSPICDVVSTLACCAGRAAA